jgi:hypothetical protein
MIDISKADRAEVLLALFNNCHNFGGTHNPMVGMLQKMLPPKGIEWARKVLEDCEKRKNYYFDYLEARGMKIDLRGPMIDEHNYDRDTSPGNARRALEGVAGVEFDPEPVLRLYSAEPIDLDDL